MVVAFADEWLETDMADAYETRIRSLQRLIKIHDTEITKLDTRDEEGRVVHAGTAATGVWRRPSR